MRNTDTAETAEQVRGEQSMQTVNPSLNSKTGGLAYSLACLAILVSSMIFSFIVEAVVASGVDEEHPRLLYFSFLASPVGLVATAIIILKLKRIKFSEVAPVKCEPKYYLIAMLVMFGTLFALSRMNDLMVKFLKLFGYKESATFTQLEKLIADASFPEFLLQLVIISLLPALCEEFIFRGVILNCAERSVGTVRAIFITAFLFMLFHGNPEQTVYQFIMGCLLAFVAVRSRSIVPSLLIHFLNNAVIVALTYFGLSGTDGNLDIPLAGYITLTVIAALCLIGGVVWLILDKKERIKCTKGGVLNLFIYAAGGILIMGANWLLMLFK